MRRFMKGFQHGEKGFTLIELLIVVAILGILAVVVVPNLAAFLGTGNLAAANTEVANVKTATLAYYADNGGSWPGTSAALTISGGGSVDYLNAPPDATYTFDVDDGLITNGTSGSGFTSALTFNVTGQEWRKS